MLFAVAGVTDRMAEAPLVKPAPLVAVSEQVYATPAVKPTTVSGDPLPVAVRVTCPGAVQVAV